MEIGLYIWNRTSKKYFILSLFLLFGCNHTEKIEHSKNHIIEKELTDGVLICRLGSGFFSNYFRKYASKEQKYSHIGMLSIENDTIYVYHSEASELTGIGFVKKDLLDNFLHKIQVFDFFECSFPDSVKTEILNRIKDYYNHKTAFDLKFDSFDDSEVYCTELIASSINDVLDSMEIKPSLNLNGKKLFALDDIYLNKNVKKLNFSNH